MSNTPTLRQYFAAKAMQGICVNAGRNAHEFNKQDEIARTAFKLADAMLERGDVEAELLEHLKCHLSKLSEAGVRNQKMKDSEALIARTEK